MRSAASFLPQNRNEQKCYTLDVIQIPSKSTKKILWGKLHQAIMEEKPADLNQRAEQLHSLVTCSCKTCVHIRCCIIL